MDKPFTTPRVTIVPPQSEEAEKGLLSSIMQLPDKWLDEFGDKLNHVHFYYPTHGTIFAAMERMHDIQKPIDLITLTNFLREDGQLETVGGAAYLTELYNEVPSSANAEYYLDTVKRMWLRRVIINRTAELSRQAYDLTSGDEQELLDVAQAEITGLSLEATKADVFQPISKGVDQILSDLQKIYERRGQDAVLGLETGFIDIDRMTGGMQEGQLWLVGARPSQGKTAVLVNMIAHLGLQDWIDENGKKRKGIPVGVFTLEMTFRQLSRRLGACVGGLNLQRFRDGFLSHETIETAPEDLEALRKAPIIMDETPALSISMFKARARRLKRKYGVKAIFVDYLTLMTVTGSEKKDEKRYQEVRQMSQGLKAVAKELEITVIAAAQLNRTPEGRKFGEPKLGDLGESGALEQDADAVMLLWRPRKNIEHYSQMDALAKELRLTWNDDQPLYTTENPDTGEKIKLDQDGIKERDRQLEEYAQLILAKQRDGPTNFARLRFVGRLMKFHNVTQKAWSNREEERQQNASENF